MPKPKRKKRLGRPRSIDVMVRNFITKLQWDLRDSYNSSSCLNEKQRAFLEEQLYDLCSNLQRRYDA